MIADGKSKQCIFTIFVLGFRYVEPYLMFVNWENSLFNDENGLRHMRSDVISFI